MFVSRLLTVLGVICLYLAGGFLSNGAWWLSLPFAAATLALWSLGIGWKSLGSEQPSRLLVLPMLAVGTLIIISGGYCSIAAMTELGPSTPHPEAGFMRISIGLGVVLSALGTLMLAQVITRAFLRRPPPPPDVEPPSPPA